MRRVLAALLGVSVLLAPATAARAQQAPAPGTALPAVKDVPAVPELPVSIARIRKELRMTPTSRTGGLRYDFHVDVVGQNPKVDFFKDFDLSPDGAVRYGGMTHQEFLNVVTPQAFRAPSGDLISLALAAIRQIKKK